MLTIVAGDAVVNAIQVEWAGSTPPTPQASYTYRGDGLRATKTAGGTTTTYTWDVGASLPEVLQDGTYTYVYGYGLVSQTDGSGTQTYVLADGLGSTRTLTDGSGTVTASYAYDVFGAVRASSGTGSTDYRFTGEFDDATTSLTYLRARWYDPSTGRFLSKDPFPGFAELPQTLHPYVYAANNPVNLTDPSGEILPLIAIVGAAWVVFEIGSSVMDAYNTIQTLSDPCASGWDKAFTSGLFLAGLLLPGGGEATAFRMVGHHVIPREILRHLPRDVFNAVRGKKGALNIWRIPENLHQDIHRGPGGGLFNQRWKEELRPLLESERVTAEDVLRIRDRLVEEFGIAEYRP